MSRRFKFESGFASLGAIPERFDEAAVKNEPMQFGSDLIHAWGTGGPITRSFISLLLGSWWLTDAEGPVVFDSRAHMLMPGWFPCIPGWHHDDIPRTRADGQPDYENPSYRAEHALLIVGDASQTEFVTDTLELDEVPLGSTVYGVWHKKIEEHRPKTAFVTPGEVVAFNSAAFHRGTAATKNGWRFFIRASKNTKRPVLNEQRRQVQVYMSAVEAGW